MNFKEKYNKIRDVFGFKIAEIAALLSVNNNDAFSLLKGELELNDWQMERFKDLWELSQGWPFHYPMDEEFVDSVIWPLLVVDPINRGVIITRIKEEAIKRKEISEYASASSTPS